MFVLLYVANKRGSLLLTERPDGKVEKMSESFPHSAYVKIFATFATKGAVF